MDKIYDVIILGAGPGGLAAGICAGRARLDTLLIEKGKDGGPIASTEELENYKSILPEEEYRVLSKRVEDDNPCVVKFYF